MVAAIGWAAAAPAPPAARVRERVRPNTRAARMVASFHRYQSCAPCLHGALIARHFMVSLICNREGWRAGLCERSKVLVPDHLLF